ncbi:MAG: hypothetical protein J6C11_08110 [Spirochaetaceae bacterium]|nr:hypothetical protein [Spirochaetaceae bacterium]
MERTPYNIALLDIFLQAMGEGFAKNVLCFEGNGGLDPNNFKQKVSKMREGNIKQAKEVRDSVSIGLRRFVDGAATDSTEKYCRKEGSDKYTNFFRGLWLPLDFPLKKILPENFFYEENEAVLAYQVAQWLVKSCEKEAGCSIDPRDVPGYQTLTLEDRKKYDEQVQQVFRPEYYSALWDVVKHGAGNKTFYKWPIDELYKECDGQKQKIDEIIRYVFRDNDGNVSSTFKKLKVESGVRQWTTFDKLFQNELKDDELKAKLQDGNLLERYQVFQSRMINAFVLENLRAVLPREVGNDLAIKIFELLFRHVKGEPVDLKAEFLVPEHDRKTTEDN